MHQYIVLHPCHKLECFKRNKWDAKSIEATHDLVQDEFDRSYWLLDIEGDDGTTHADGDISVSDHLLTPQQGPLLNSYHHHVNYSHAHPCTQQP